MQCPVCIKGTLYENYVDVCTVPLVRIGADGSAVRAHNAIVTASDTTSFTCNACATVWEEWQTLRSALLAFEV